MSVFSLAPWPLLTKWATVAETMPHVTARKSVPAGTSLMERQVDVTCAGPAMPAAECVGEGIGGRTRNCGPRCGRFGCTHPASARQNDDVIFEQLLQRIWDTETEHGAGPVLTESMLLAAEQILGVKLPDEYVALLRVRNGGRISSEFCSFPSPQPTSWADDHVPFDECFGIDSKLGSVTDSGALNEEWGQPHDLVLLTGDGHWWIALDYRGSAQAEPAVVWFDNEVGQDIRLASSFREFLEGLVPRSQFDVGAPRELDQPPAAAYVRDGGALSGSIESIQQDLRLMKEGQRGLANTKAWIRARSEGPLLRLPDAQTVALRHALEVCDRADDEAGTARAAQRIVAELEALIPRWIESRCPGWALDALYLREHR